MFLRKFCPFGKELFIFHTQKGKLAIYLIEALIMLTFKKLSNKSFQGRILKLVQTGGKTAKNKKRWCCMPMPLVKKKVFLGPTPGPLGNASSLFLKAAKQWPSQSVTTNIWADWAVLGRRAHKGWLSLLSVSRRWWWRREQQHHSICILGQ